MRGVAASETRGAQTGRAEWPAGLCAPGVGRSSWRPGRSRDRVTNRGSSRTPLERAAGAGDSPVGERVPARATMREYRRARAIRRETGSTTIQG